MTLQKSGIHALALRFLALALMLLHHVFLLVLHGPRWVWMQYLGRMAMPIFCFLIAEGFFHTKNFWKYAGRLFVFALVSEIPFDLFLAGRPNYLSYQNVMFTLLLGLFSLRVLIWGRSKLRLWSYLTGVAGFALCALAADLLHCDYGGIGVAMVAIFGLCRGMKLEKLWQIATLACIVCLNGVRHGDLQTDRWFSMLALLPIWCYNGQKGPSSKVLQYAAYWFYPLHLLVLAVLVRFI